VDGQAIDPWHLAVALLAGGGPVGTVFMPMWAAYSAAIHSDRSLPAPASIHIAPQRRGAQRLSVSGHSLSLSAAKPPQAVFAEGTSDASGAQAAEDASRQDRCATVG
jgi:hypothetical protein